MRLLINQLNFWAFRLWQTKVDSIEYIAIAKGAALFVAIFLALRPKRISTAIAKAS